MQTTRVVETIVKLWLYFTNEISIKDLLPFRIFNIFHHYCIHQIVVRIVSLKFSEGEKKKEKDLLPRSIDQFSIQREIPYPFSPWPFNKTTNNRRNEIYRIVWRVNFNEKNVGSRHQTKFYSACLGPCLRRQKFSARNTKRPTGK